MYYTFIKLYDYILYFHWIQLWNYLCTFPIACNWSEIVCWPTFNDFCFYVWHSSSSNNACKSAPRKVLAFLSLPRQNHHFWSIETIRCVMLPNKRVHKNLPQEFYELQHQISFRKRLGSKTSRECCLFGTKFVIFIGENKNVAVWKVKRTTHWVWMADGEPLRWSRFSPFKITKYVN